MNATPEQWRAVVGYEGLYEVSDHGRVRSLDRTIPHNLWPHTSRTIRGRMLTPNTRRPHGYQTVQLCRNNKVNRAEVHWLVLEAFVGSRPPGMFGLHWDDDGSNNRLSNLRWGTNRENQLDAIRNGRNALMIRDECVHGHKYTEENTYRREHAPGRFARHCRTCRRQQARDFRARSKGK
ncbi:NUMOD4 domain-containing protein [Mycobacterium intracellulare]|uniref:NUMOD4 domain-containing protein n=1 Tax=Mycobacterium intracellulare TaxID=1767 RepID=UPI00109EC205